MKIFDVDVSVKWIFIEIDGNTYQIQFRDNLRKGIHDISVLKHGGKVGEKIDVKITGAYPPLRQWLPEVWQIWFPVWIRWKAKKFQQLHKR